MWACAPSTMDWDTMDWAVDATLCALLPLPTSYPNRIPIMPHHCLCNERGSRPNVASLSKRVACARSE